MINVIAIFIFYFLYLTFLVPNYCPLIAFVFITFQ